ncbi:uncharacterized protein NEMAJ01_2026 [Nematocida major]|uniref:uncharacterized protein n=1 Tax=Nematocida major TaxID=1912982 RepID=UPI002007A8D1|nr:uncharacterized protein NEMAJ01_2026 [Nematocida major]KAH9387130.1 hypothetical protein NEMAJ01_2026 [Nematocida major]
MTTCRHIKKVLGLERALKEHEKCLTKAEQCMVQLGAKSMQSTEQLDSAERKHARLVNDLQGSSSNLRAAMGNGGRLLEELHEVEARLELEKAWVVSGGGKQGGGLR